MRSIMGTLTLSSQNNDLLVPDGTIDSLSKALETDRWGALIPTVSKRGSSYRLHTLNQQHSDIASWTDQPFQFQRVGDALQTTSEPYIHAVSHMNGYMMAFRVSKFIPLQYNVQKRLLFDPRKINIGNEDELFARARSKTTLGVHGNAFVFHFKGYTLTRKDRIALEQP